MNLKLIEYISKWLAPKEYRLELKNRLENLCALSGTPMSPGLHQWVTDKFGLEMTRVIEDYSTFTSPKLSPELLSVVDRIVPTNYQGDDVNLSFRQLFDVSCAPPKCAQVGFLDWSSTLPLPTSLNNLYLDTGGAIPAFNNNPQDLINGVGNLRTLIEGYPEGSMFGRHVNGSALIYDQCYVLSYYDVDNTSLPYIDLYDQFGSYVTSISFNAITVYSGECGLVCYETMFDMSNTVFTIFFIYTIFLDYTTYPNILYPYNSTFVDFTDTVLMNAFVKDLFGQQASYSLTNDGVNYTMIISNAYNYDNFLTPQLVLNNSGGVYMNKITCP